MCGIAGVVDLGAPSSSSEFPQRARVQKMTRALQHRGPDAEDFFLDPRASLGHRRLAILDLSPTGNQPMQLVKDGPVIVYNGECYNFSDLRDELIAQGCRFRGHSDTEVILQCYQTWGRQGLTRLEGIFALAIWDPKAQVLIAMRDRLGIKPFYYNHAGQTLAFGSEIKAVRASGLPRGGLDEQALSEYLWYGNTHDDRSFDRNIRALEPGHWMVFDRDGLRITPWWRIEDWLDTPPPGDRAMAQAQVREALDRAVRRQLVADVPVGLFLSGGIDSSAIAAVAAGADAPVTSYAAGFDFDRGVNELAKAARVADHLGLAHRPIHVSGADLEKVVQDLAHAHDEPFADAANIPLYLMCGSLNDGTKVVLQGDGGDELFAGYRRYAMLQHTAAARATPGALTKMIRSLGIRGSRLARMITALGQRDPARRMAQLLTMETTAAPPEDFLQADFRDHLGRTTDPILAYRRAADRFSGHKPINQMLLTDLTVQLPGQFLPKVDRATMAAGIEARVPLLDEHMLRLALVLPEKWKVAGRQKKIILRDSVRDRLPAEILDGPKTGFGTPYGYWLRSGLAGFARERLLDPAVINRFALDRARVEQALENHISGQQDRGFTLWKLLHLALWDAAE